jgi:hypothetical protein
MPLNIRSIINRVSEKNMKEELTDGTPAGSIAACHPRGCIQTDVLTKWFVHFVHFIKPSANDPVLLTVDGHYSNTKNLDVEDKAREHSVVTVSLPTHSKHKMQPLDAGFMKSLKHMRHKKLKRVKAAILVVLLRLS